jgi:cofilin
MESLENAKLALDRGLIGQADYDTVKAAFLKAQQFKAGLDAGFILPEDYQQVKERFLDALVGLPVVRLQDPAPQPVAITTEQVATNGFLPEPSSTAEPTDVGENEVVHAEPVAVAVAVASAPSAIPERRAQTEVPTNIPRLGGALRKSTGPTVS